jgi:hypothetical protein
VILNYSSYIVTSGEKSEVSEGGLGLLLMVAIILIANRLDGTLGN